MRVIVVGGGIGGLVCALHLARHKHEVTVLEKGDYWGGRLFTMPAGYEAGGARFHEGHRHLQRLLRAFRLDSIPIPGLRQVDAAALHRLCTHTASRDTTLHHPDLEMLKDQLGYKGEFDLTHGQEAQRLVCQDLTRSTYALVKGGFSVLIAKIQQRIEHYGGTMQLETSVTQVDGAPGDFRVTLADGNVRTADRVVLAVPPSVVRQVYPAAPDLDLLVSTPLLRIYGVWEQAWWTTEDKQVDEQLGWIIPAGPQALMLSYTDGELADRWHAKHQQHGQDAVQAELLERLRAVFPDRTIPEPQTCTFHYWPEGVHFFKPRTDPRTDKQLMQQWTQGPVPLVGEAYSLHHAWVEGALSTGCRAVRAVEKEMY